jgi:hypothetical protein
MSIVIASLQPIFEQDLGLQESNPGKTVYFGSNIKQYLDQIKTAAKRLPQLYAMHTLLLGASMQESNAALDEANRTVAEAENSAHKIKPVQSAGTAAWNSQRVEVNGAAIDQSITASGDQVTIVQNTVGTPSGQTYTISKTDLAAGTATIRQQASVWILSVTMPRRTAQLLINTGAGVGQREVISRFDLFFATEADARAAAQILVPSVQ